jgi:P4 family phage/plasmid primase-like protien
MSNDLDIFKQFFLHRIDDFIIQIHSGYKRAKRPLKDQDIIDHLAGVETIGAYLIDPKDNTVLHLVLDIDFENFASIDKQVMKQVTTTFKSLGINENQTRIEFSGRRGFHIWIFFAEPIPAALALRLGKLIVVRSHVKKEFEIFPKQPELDEKGYGSGIKLPLGIHKESGKRSHFVDQDLYPIISWVEHLQSTTLTSRKQVEEILISFEEALPVPCAPDPSNAFQNLINCYGEHSYFNKGKLIALNQNFWAGLYQTENVQFYEPNEKVFYRYNERTGIYAETSEDTIRTEISNRILKASRELELPQLESKRTTATLNQIIALLKGIAEKRSAFRKDWHYLHLANGAIVFNDRGEADLRPFSPELISRNSCPIAFNEHAKCERFLNELLRPALKDADILLIQKYMGLCLLGNNLIQRFLILEGTSGGGKGTLSLVLQKLIGQENVTELRTNHLSEKFELYRLLKKTLLIGIDVPGNFLSQKGAYVIKGLVGGDIFDAEQKGGNGNFPIQGNFCIVVSSNARLKVRLDGDNKAWKRRLLIVRYEAPPPVKKVPHFDEILIKEEGSGILNWFLQGLGLLLKDIQEFGDIRLTPSQEGVVDALLAESDSLRNFLTDNIIKDDEENLSVAEIVEAYARYCPSKGWNAKPHTDIYKELSGLMLELFATTQSHSVERGGTEVRGYKHVGFRRTIHVT